MAYRVRLHNGRAVGPFSKEEVGKLLLKGHIDGNEKYQVFPNGKWLDLKNYSDLSSYLVKLIEQKPFVAKSENMKSKDNASAIENDLGFKEFKFEIKNDYLANELSEQDESKQEERIKIDLSEKEEFEYQDTVTEKGDNDLDKTIIRKRPVAPDVDKTRIIKIDEEDREFVTEQRKEISVSTPNAKEKTELDVLDPEKGTEIVNYASLYPSLKKEAKRAERKYKKEEEKKPLVEEDLKDETLTKVEVIKKKGMRPIAAFACLALLYFLIFDGEEKPTFQAPYLIEVNFPFVEDYEDSNKSEIFFQKGLQELKKNRFVNKVNSTKFFSKSLSYKFKKNQALPYLIKTYAEIYPSVKKKREASKVIYNLLEIAKYNSMQDTVLVEGIATFYLNAKKSKTALKFIERYLRVSKPTIGILTAYLRALIDVGDLKKADVAFNQLNKQKSIPLDGVLVMSEYLVLDQKYKEAEELLIRFQDEHKNRVPFQLALCNFLLRKEKFDKLKLVLDQIGIQSAERSREYTAKYFEYLGMYRALQGNNQDAAYFFKQSLAFFPSNELRSKLAELELGGTQKVQSLILESKIQDKIRQSELLAKQKKWDQAFSLAIDAVDLSKYDIEAQVWLAKLQSKRGFFESSIKTLESLRTLYPQNVDVNKSLLQSFIRAFWLDKAAELFVSLSQTDFERSAEYESMWGRYFLKKKNIRRAVVHLKEAVRRDPLNHEDYFELAKIYSKARDYPNSKSYLTKAMDLDPDNEEYISLYGNIIYERDGVETAVGYLLKKLADYPDEPQFLGDVAMYYYRSGQQKYYESYKKKLEKVPYQNKSFYKFMLDNARRENRFDEVIQYSNELILVDPGDLYTRLDVGKYFYDQKKYEKAIEEFQEIKLRLKTFPRVNYYLSQIYMNLQDYPTALKLAEEEIEYNPKLYYGYHAKGLVLYAQQNYVNAVKALETALSRQPNSLETLKALGEIRFAQNDLEKARDLFLRAKRVNDIDPDVYRNLGYIFQKSGQRQLAIEYFEDYLKLYLDSPHKAEIEGILRTLR